MGFVRWFKSKLIKDKGGIVKGKRRQQKQGKGNLTNPYTLQS